MEMLAGIIGVISIAAMLYLFYELMKEDGER